jgi:hypothetical protein
MGREMHLTAAITTQQQQQQQQQKPSVSSSSSNWNVTLCSTQAWHWICFLCHQRGEQPAQGCGGFGRASGTVAECLAVHQGCQLPLHLMLSQ